MPRLRRSRRGPEREGVTGDSITMTTALAEEILSFARDRLPNEACGLVSGLRAPCRAATFHPARNALSSPTAYDVHPEDLVRIVHEIEAGATELVAVFHSHPATAAVPSATDLREAAYPVVQLLASLADAGAGPATALRAWLIADGAPREIALRIV